MTEQPPADLTGAMTNVYAVGAELSKAVLRADGQVDDLTVEQIALALAMVLQEALQERLRVSAFRDRAAGRPPAPVDPGGDPLPVPAHLIMRTSDRGLLYLPEIPSRDGGGAVLGTSSLAFRGPHIRMTATAPVDLNEPDGPTREAPLHLSAPDALRLADQLVTIVASHYLLHFDADQQRMAGPVVQVHQGLAALIAITERFMPAGADGGHVHGDG
jgi:hypothetical protein